MTDESGLRVMLCMKDVLIHPLERETLWHNLKLLRWIQHFFHIHVLIFPTARAILISILLPLLSSCRRRDTSLCGKDKKEHSLPLVVTTRSFSPLSTALTANKEILPIWQNISRVTFHKAGFMHCEKQGAELSPELGQAGLVLLHPLHSHRVQR